MYHSDSKSNSVISKEQLACMKTHAQILSTATEWETIMEHAGMLQFDITLLATHLGFDYATL